MSDEQNKFQFVVGWLLMILVLALINKTRLGHVIIYYALLLMILFVLVVEYKQLVPYFQGLQTVSEFTATEAKNTPLAQKLTKA